ncbi:MAG TPA: DNA-binding domain-containing protein [Stellaceae bacterium]|nr:DNA-binding domain-containing protein [Stellaceae bacterium]
MLGLPELQASFARALLGFGDDAISDAIAEDGLSRELRLDIYRNTVLVSLTDALAATFPVVCRLVDERFFRYAAAEFIRAHPPERPCLSAYGEGFAHFLAAFPACRELVYLPDMARLEWLMHRAAHAQDAAPISPAALGGLAEAEMPRLVLELDPSLGLVSSPWPIDRIWRANRCGADGAERIDLSSGGARLEVRRVADEILLGTLDPGRFAFRAELQRGSTLARAAEAALAADSGFDLTRALADLFREGAVVAIGLAPPEDLRS